MTPVHLVHQGATLAIVGLTISLHVLGMFGLSPVFGLLADRVGREFTIALGQVVLLAALLTTAIGAESEIAITVGLVLLGLGWSASTVAGSTLVAESADLAHRTTIQGRSDLLQSATGALGGAAAGLVLALIGYSGLALVAISLVAVVFLVLLGRMLRGRGAVTAPVALEGEEA
jgi:MFS family permease